MTDIDGSLADAVQEAMPTEDATLQLPTAPDNVEMVGLTAAEAAFPTGEEEKKAIAESQAPEKLAGKYESVQELISAYEEAQRKITELSQQQLPQQSVPEMQAERDIKGVLDATGLDMAQIRASWDSLGSLTPEQYDAFRTVGYSKDVVDTFITGQYAVAGQQANIQVQMKDNAISMAGGEDQLNNVMEWAKNHYNEPQSESLNGRLSDPRTYESAIKELLYDFRAEVGSSNSRPLAGVEAVAPPPGVDGYKTVQEVLAVFAQLRETGITEEIKARLAKTPQQLLEGVE